LVPVDSQAYSQIHYYYCCNFVGGVSFSTQTVERAPCLPRYGPTVIDQRYEACNVNLEVRAWEYSDCFSFASMCAEVCVKGTLVKLMYSGSPV